MAQLKKVESILKDALLQAYQMDSEEEPFEDVNKVLITAIRQALFYLSK